MTAYSYNKDELAELHNKQHIEVFKSIDNFLIDLTIKLKKQVQVIETNKLEQYKQDLLKTKLNFGQINQKRCDNAIKKAVHSHKKSLEKQCAGFLEKSMQVSKVYDGLKAKLVRMDATEQQLQHQIQYLHKQIKTSTNKKQFLNKQLQSMIDWQTEVKQQKTNKSKLTTPFGSKLSNGLVVAPSKLSQNPKQMQKTMNRTKKWQYNSERRLKQKIQGTKDFIDSLAFQQSSVQQLFSNYNLQHYSDPKSKLSLIQQILSDQKNKRLIYSLLFEQN